MDYNAIYGNHQSDNVHTEHDLCLGVVPHPSPFATLHTHTPPFPSPPSGTPPSTPPTIFIRS